MVWLHHANTFNRFLISIIPVALADLIFLFSPFFNIFILFLDACATTQLKQSTITFTTHKSIIWNTPTQKHKLQKSCARRWHIQIKWYRERHREYYAHIRHTDTDIHTKLTHATCVNCHHSAACDKCTFMSSTQVEQVCATTTPTGHWTSQYCNFGRKATLNQKVLLPAHIPWTGIVQA